MVNENIAKQYQDAVQGPLKALENFETYDATRSTSAWIMTIARNHLINHWRDTKPTSPLPEAEETDEDRSPDAFWLKSALKSWHKEKNEGLAYELLAELDPAEAEIVTFHYLFGYSYAEIATQKAMSEGAVKVAAHRAIKKLRQNM